MIAIIDYGSGNVGAISNIYTQLRIDHQITADHQQIKDASHIILAGVGSFDFTMNSLNQSGLTGLLKELAAQGRPIMGICVGMQILGQSSEEGELEGLGFIEGEVKKIDESLLQSKLKLPHMGWNSVSPTQDQPIFEGVDTQRGFYFLHSYYFAQKHDENIAATVNYGKEFTCTVRKDNIYGMQFHPEKSHSNGITIFRNFAAL